jgi:hypothetical protein
MGLNPIAKIPKAAKAPRTSPVGCCGLGANICPEKISAPKRKTTFPDPVEEGAAVLTTPDGPLSPQGRQLSCPPGREAIAAEAYPLFWSFQQVLVL